MEATGRARSQLKVTDVIPVGGDPDFVADPKHGLKKFTQKWKNVKALTLSNYRKLLLKNNIVMGDATAKEYFGESSDRPSDRSSNRSSNRSSDRSSDRSSSSSSSSDESSLIGISDTSSEVEAVAEVSTIVDGQLANAFSNLNVVSSPPLSARRLSFADMNTPTPTVTATSTVPTSVTSVRVDALPGTVDNPIRIYVDKNYADRAFPFEAEYVQNKVVNNAARTVYHVRTVIGWCDTQKWSAKMTSVPELKKNAVLVKGLYNSAFLHIEAGSNQDSTVASQNETAASIKNDPARLYKYWLLIFEDELDNSIISGDTTEVTVNYRAITEVNQFGTSSVAPMMWFEIAVANYRKRLPGVEDGGINEFASP